MDHVYAIGDIHGQIAPLQRALRLIEADGGAEAPVVFLGDYVDRGADSRAVLQTLIDGQADGRPWTCLKGNHDRMFQRFLEEGEVNDPAIKSGNAWLHARLGGLRTLGSYLPLTPEWSALDALRDPSPDERATIAALHAASREAVPADHLSFLQGLPLWHAAGDLIFAHAGIRPGLPMGDQQESDLIWIREPFLSDTRDHGALIVHGHTALDRIQHCGNRVNLDGGAGYGRPLVPVVFEHRACFMLTERGRWPLRPD